MSSTTNRSAPTQVALTELAALLPGQIQLPGDPRWETSRLGWSLPVDQQPIAVQLRHLGGALSRAAAADIHIAFVEVAMALQCHLPWPTAFEFLSADDGPARAFSADALARLREITNIPDPAASP
jgi:hypothetical protein